MLIIKKDNDVNLLKKRMVNNRFNRNVLYVGLLQALLVMSWPASVKAATILGNSGYNERLSGDSEYIVEAGTIRNSAGGTGDQDDATLVINGLTNFTLTNSGTIKSTRGIESGIRINQSGTVVNEATGSISGNRGIYVSGSTGAQDIINRGDISAMTSHGIYYNNANGTLDNYGTINGGPSVKSSSTAILTANGSTITLNNHAGGAIYSGAADPSYGTAVFLQSGSGNIINNDGLIKGNFGGVRTSNSAIVNLTNNGTIESIKRAGIELAGGNGSIINLNAGSVTGSAGVLVQSNNNTIFNAATITGNSGSAVHFSGHNNNLTLQSGSNLVGDVISTGSNNKVILQGAGSEDANFMSLNAATGFSSLSMLGDLWTLSGNISLGGSTADTLAVNSGTLILEGSVTQAYATGGTYIESAATLQFGSNTGTGMVNGNIINNGSLVFNRSDAVLNYDSAIAGSGDLTKLNSGRLIFTGDHSYSGNTLIDAGTLQIGNGGTSGSVAGNIINNGELVFDRSNNYAYAGIISGNGSVIQQGAGHILLDQNQSYSGTTTVNSGALILTNNAQLTSTSPVTIAAGALFGGYGGVSGDVINNGLLAIADAASGSTSMAAGIFQIGGDLTNSGEVRMGSAQWDSQLIVNGNYVGNGGLLTLNTLFSGISSASDKLVVQGDTSGTTQVFINAFSGVIAPNHNGIEVVHVDGQSNGQFVLANRVAVGAYEYFLHQGKPGESNGNWYLLSEMDSRSLNKKPSSIWGAKPDHFGPIYRPEAGSYMSNMSAANRLFNMRLIDREGSAEESSLWLHQVGGHTRFRDSSGQLHNTSNRYVIQGGGEVLATQFAANDRLGLGVMVDYGRASSRTNSQISGYSSKGKVDGYSVGLYGTWYQNAGTLNGLYVDSWANYSWLNSSVNGEQLKGESYKLDSYSASLESGYRLPFYQSESAQIAITPQAQVIWNGLKAKDHTETNGTNVTFSGNDSFQTRVGLKFSHDSINKQSKSKDIAFSVYAETNWLYNEKTSAATMDGVTIKQAGSRNIGELKLGVEGQVTQGLSLWSHATQHLGDNHYSDTSAIIGAKYRF